MSTIESNTEGLTEETQMEEFFDIKPLQDAFKEHTINSNDREIIKISNDVMTFSLLIDYDELNEELSFEKFSGEYYTITENSIRVILKNINKDNQLLFRENNFIKLTEESQNIKLNLKSANESSLLIYNNLHLIMRAMDYENEEMYSIENLIDTDFVILEIDFKDAFDHNFAKEKLQAIIDSCIAHLSFQINILLEHPSDIILQSTAENNFDKKVVFSLLEEEEPLAFFRYAEKTPYLHLKFLEYYHVLEYYFYQRRIKDMEQIIGKVINKQLLNRKQDRKEHYKELNEIWEFYYSVNQSKIGERDELKYILNNQIGFETIKNILEETPALLIILNKDVVDIKDSKIDTSKIVKRERQESVFKPNIDEVDKIQFCNQIAERIYKIRNFIVHSKKFDNDSLFIASNEQLQSLLDEIKLLRSLAYMMLKNEY